jgi:hypothetical protein
MQTISLKDFAPASQVIILALIQGVVNEVAHVSPEEIRERAYGLR